MLDPTTIDRLATYRLRRNLTFQQLADEMAAKGYPMRPRVLHLALTRRHSRAPLDRTLYKLEQFLVAAEASETHA